MLTGQLFDGVQVRQNSVERMTLVAFIGGDGIVELGAPCLCKPLCVVGFIARIKIAGACGEGLLNMAVQDPVDAEAGRKHAEAGDDDDDERHQTIAG